MSKLIRLEVSRKRHTTVAVVVPDDFDEAKLHTWVYHDAVRLALDEADPTWDDDDLNEDISVESVEAGQYSDLGDVCPDITEAMAACEQREAEARARRAALAAEIKANKTERAKEINRRLNSEDIVS